MKVISDKQNWETVKEKREKFLKQKQFPALKNPYSDRMDPIMHTGYLMFIRSKFLFLGLIENIEERNLYVSYAILKSFWENVTAFGYYYLRISSLLEKNNKEEAFSLSKKMGLGGRKFLTEEMVQKKGDTLEDYTTPNVLTMMEKVDEDWKRVLGIDSLFKELYETQIAEGGHTTYIGLSIAGRWLPDKSLLPDLKRSWTREERSSLLNLAALSSTVFHYYWEKFYKLKD